MKPSRTVAHAIAILSIAILATSCGSDSSNSSASPNSSNSPVLMKSTLLSQGTSYLVDGIATSGTAVFVFDSHGNIFYPDANGYRLMKIDTSGNQTVYMQGVLLGAIYRPTQIAIDRQDNLYILDNNDIKKISPSKVVTDIITLPWSSDAVSYMAVDSSGNVYVTENSSWQTSKNTIRKITPNGTISVFAGSGTAAFADGNGINASFNFPKGIAFDSQDNLIVVDAGNKMIRKITPSGDVTTIAGSGTKNVRDGIALDSDFYFYERMGQVAIDSNDTIYIAEYKDTEGYIRTIATDGTVSTICGSATNNYSNKVGSCNEIFIWVDSGISVGPDGGLYYISEQKLYRLGM